jgi:hypothetical protein
MAPNLAARLEGGERPAKRFTTASDEILQHPLWWQPIARGRRTFLDNEPKPCLRRIFVCSHAFPHPDQYSDHSPLKTSGSLHAIRRFDLQFYAGP